MVMTEFDIFKTGGFPEPRPFQTATLEALRAGAGGGHKNQLLMSPTGSGKTDIAMRVFNGALAKHMTMMFVTDRRTLIEQTSATADRYGLCDHGVIQGNHPRTDYSRPFQIASAQTLERRDWLDVDIIIIDEVHTQMKV